MPIENPSSCGQDVWVYSYADDEIQGLFQLLEGVTLTTVNGITAFPLTRLTDYHAHIKQRVLTFVVATFA